MRNKEQGINLLFNTLGRNMYRMNISTPINLKKKTKKKIRKKKTFIETSSLGRLPNKALDVLLKHLISSTSVKTTLRFKFDHRRHTYTHT